MCSLRTIMFVCCGVYANDIGRAWLGKYSGFTDISVLNNMRPNYSLGYAAKKSALDSRDFDIDEAKLHNPCDDVERLSSVIPSALALTPSAETIT